jgi:acetylornithine deacetylase/succinyl-diaminopimelate desuccinylase-like protein
MIDQKDKDNVVKRINRDELAQLTKDLVDISSPTGSEKAIGEFILDWYARNNIRPVRQEIDPNRVNAVGILEGKSGGVSLMINGHMDTSYTGTEEDRMFCRTLEPESELKGAVRDGKVFGLGASNMKSGLAAFMVAGKAIKESALPLKGDLILAAVAGEISRTPVDSYQSGAYRGEGTGTHHLLTHGIQSDYAIVADRSGHSIVWAQNGVAQIKVSTFGDPHAAWGVTREEKAPEVSSAILKMVKVLQAVDAWAAEFERAHVYSSAHGAIVPKVNIGAIQGGAPFRPNYEPGVGSI